MCRSMLVAAALAVLCIPTGNAHAAPGDLDPTFGGGDGIVASDLGTFGSSVHDLAMQADGRFLVAGDGGADSADFLVARYNADGSFDTTSFGALVAAECGRSWSASACRIAWCG